MRFTARVEDLVKKRVLVEFPCIFTTSLEGANSTARQHLKKTQIYQDDENVRDFVRVLENMEDVDTAGHEFDVLPEELRRYALVITRIDK